ncbi:MAG: transglycosylase SLT domain-containing protein [Candidatus Methylomirabilales bacterium]
MKAKWAEVRASRKAWTFLLLLLLGPVQALAQDLPPALSQALGALEASDCRAALKALQAIPNPPPEAIRHRINFLTGYCLFKTDRPAHALPVLEQASEEYGLLADYAITYAAQAAQALDDLQKTIALLSRLLARYPASRLAEEAHFRLATIYLEARRGEDAEKALLAFLDRYPGSALASQASLRLAKLLLALDRPREAIPFLKRLYIRLPADPPAAEAERLLQEIPHLPPLTPDESYLRAKSLFQEGRYRDAATALTPILQSDPRNAEARFLLGRCLFAMKEYHQAIAILLPLTDPDGRSPLQAEALYIMGRAFLRSGDYLQAIAHLERLTALYSQSRLADDALYLIGLNQEERGEDGVALEVYARLLRLYPDRDMGDSARWRRAWLFYRQRKLRKAAHELAHILKDYRHSPLRAQTLYWRGRLLEQIGKRRLAARMYRGLLKEASLHPYYARAARKHLGLKPKRLSPRPPPTSEDHFSPVLAKARELFFLRLWEEAAAEYWELARAHPDQLALQWETCQVLLRANQFDRAIRIARRTVHTSVKTGQRKKALTSFWTFLYPRGFWPWVDQYAQETHLDPYLVIALIREESGFSATALSRAGAQGLMQLLPVTAERVARENGLPSPHDLYTPGLNIALGTRYLAQLHQEFGGNLVLALAAYNAGPHNVRRWLKERPFQDPDTFVEEIPYPETRQYVKRVLGSYDRYRTLYVPPG